MTSSPPTFDLCAIGNVCIDIIDTVDDTFLTRHALTKSICTYINSAQLQNMMSELKIPVTTPGGVGANVSHVIAALGGSAIFQGKGSSDHYTGVIREDLEKHGILTHIPTVASPSMKSSQVLCLDTPDGDRTFASYDGAAKTLCAADLNLGYIRRSKITYFDAYTFISADTEDALTIAHQASVEAGNMCCFNPCDISIIEHYPSAMNAVLDVCEMVICNLTEARALFPGDTMEGIANKLADRFNGGAITDGARGAYGFLNGEVTFIPPRDTSSLRSINSNGAGDHFAAGFLFGVLRGYDLEQAGLLGNLCAYDCLTHTGARPLGTLKHLVASLTKI